MTIDELNQEIADLRNELDEAIRNKALVDMQSNLLARKGIENRLEKNKVEAQQIKAGENIKTLQNKIKGKTELYWQMKNI
jgi:ElaB/YqjD/DUF883 family membrane-anchored ribosome-binding protein